MEIEKSSRGRCFEWDSNGRPGLKRDSSRVFVIVTFARKPYIQPAAELTMNGNKNVPNPSFEPKIRGTISNPVKRGGGGGGKL